MTASALRCSLLCSVCCRSARWCGRVRCVSWCVAHRPPCSFVAWAALWCLGRWAAGTKARAPRQRTRTTATAPHDTHAHTAAFAVVDSTQHDRVSHRSCNAQPRPAPGPPPLVRRRPPFLFHRSHDQHGHQRREDHESERTDRRIHASNHSLVRTKAHAHALCVSRRSARRMRGLRLTAVALSLSAASAVR